MPPGRRAHPEPQKHLGAAFPKEGRGNPKALRQYFHLVAVLGTSYYCCSRGEGSAALSWPLGLLLLSCFSFVLHLRGKKAGSKMLPKKFGKPPKEQSQKCFCCCIKCPVVVKELP